MAGTTHQSSSSSPNVPRNYDVFLSFRGEDTRKSFISHLYDALVQAGVHTFIDEDELQRGEEIGKGLSQAIQESRISIPVFTKNYASSRWCLDELAQILDCRRTIDQTVLPIFLDGADPSDVRKQSGSFGEAFGRHEARFGMERVNRWREALREATELSGWNMNDVENGHESKLIHTVVKEVTSKLDNSRLNVGKYLVGIDSFVKEMIDLLNIEPNEVRIVGIYGMGGIGKTTIAKAVYNQISNNYVANSFLGSVREYSQQPNGLLRLQKQLYLDIMRHKNPFISNVSRGINLIKERFGSKKILVILDDVDQEEQLNALVGGRDWFGPGSRIMITTRDEHLLNRLVVDEIYMPKELDLGQSLQLFSMHAFNRDQPLEDYMELSKRVVLTTGGLPLALEVLGSSLFDNRILRDWEEKLEKLKKIPLVEVQKKLKISYDGLDEQEKDIFLDIACFFIRMDKQDAIDIFKACGFSAQDGIKVLIRKSLVKIDDNKLTMHDQLRDMGRQIVRDESSKEPGMRSRLWCCEDVLDVLNRRSGSRNIEGLLLNFDEDKQIEIKEGHLNAEAFAAMSKLRLLRVNNAHIVGNFEHLSKELRWFCWQGCPLKSIPTNIHLDKLVIFDLQYSNITRVWNGWRQNKLVEKLKVLNLSHCYSLAKTPEFSGLPSLERLILEGCTRLVEIHESIGHLKRLVFLNMKDCNNLVELPSSICMLGSLESLILSNCSKISSLPANLGNMGALTKLLLDNTAIEELPDSIGLLKNLGRLDLQKLSPGGGKSSSRMPCPSSRLESSLNIELGRIPVLDLLIGSLLIVLKSRSMWCLRSLRSNPNSKITKFPDSFSGLCSLQTLDLSNCNMSEGAIPRDFERLFSLKFLVLDSNNFCSLPDSITRLSQLESLSLNHCTKLQSLPEDIGRLSSLCCLYIVYCNNLCSLSTTISGLSRLRELVLNHCTKLKSLPEDFGKLSSLRALYLEYCNNLCNLPENISGLSQLEQLQLSHCTKLQSLPEDLGRLSSLQSLSLDGCNNLCSLPANISGLSRLGGLYLHNCSKLQSLPELPSSLSCLDASNCVSIRSLPDLSNMQDLNTILISGCKNLAEIHGLGRLESLDCIVSRCISVMANAMSKGLVQGISESLKYIDVSGSEVPEWFNHQNSLSCEVPTLCGRKIQGLIVCLVLPPDDLARTAKGYSQAPIQMNVHITRNNIRLPTHAMPIYASPVSSFGSSHFYRVTKLDYHVNLEEGDQIQVSATALLGRFQVRNGGIQLVYKPNKGYELVAEDITSQESSISESVPTFLLSSSSSYVIHGGGSLGGARRGRHDEEAGPSSGRSNAVRPIKRLRIESGQPVNLERGD